LHKIKLSDKKGALDSLARHLGMFTDKTEISGPNGGPIVTQTKEQRDAAVAAALAADS
jgi:phage terminase small subunit